MSPKSQQKITIDWRPDKTSGRLEFEEGYIRLGTGELAPELFPRIPWRRSFDGFLPRSRL